MIDKTGMLVYNKKVWFYSNKLPHYGFWGKLLLRLCESAKIMHKILLKC